MSCPQCGDVCRCEPEFRLPQASPRALRPRFELDSCEPVRTTALIDPEAYDTSEERFSASLEERPSASPRFVLDVRETGQNEPSSELSDRAHTPTPQAASSVAEEELPAVELSPSSAAPATDVPTDPSHAEVTPDSWKDEVAARLNSYRARRKPKPPRYPSLRLKFDTPESRTPVRPTEAAVPAHIMDNLAPAAYEPEPASPAPEPRFQPPPETA